MPSSRGRCFLALRPQEKHTAHALCPPGAVTVMLSSSKLNSFLWLGKFARKVAWFCWWCVILVINYLVYAWQLIEAEWCMVFIRNPWLIFSCRPCYLIVLAYPPPKLLLHASRVLQAPVQTSARCWLLLQLLPVPEKATLFRYFPCLSFFFSISSQSYLFIDLVLGLAVGFLMNLNKIIAITTTKKQQQHNSEC